MPPKFTPDFQPTLLKNTNQILKAYNYGAITLYGQTFQSKFIFTNEDSKLSLITPHLPQISKRDSVCSLPCSIDFTNGIA